MRRWGGGEGGDCRFISELNDKGAFEHRQKEVRVEPCHHLREEHSREKIEHVQRA